MTYDDMADYIDDNFEPDDYISFEAYWKNILNLIIHLE